MNQDQFTLILVRLDEISHRLDSIENDLQRVSKHVPFVDSLSESGVVKTIKAINGALAYLNPLGAKKMIERGSSVSN